MQPTLADFVVTEGSRGALALVRALIQSRSSGPRLVLLHGPTGVGKTHLLRAAAHLSGPNSRAATVADTVGEILQRASPAESDLLTIDDLQTVARMPVTQREIGRYLEERVHAGTRVLAAAGVPPIELGELMNRLCRIESARIVAIRPPDTDEMALLANVLASRCGIGLEAETARTIAEHAQGDVRLAQGAISRLRFVTSMGA